MNKFSMFRSQVVEAMREVLGTPAVVAALESRVTGFAYVEVTEPSSTGHFRLRVTTANGKTKHINVNVVEQRL